MSIVIPLSITALALFCLAAGRFAQRRIHRTQTERMCEVVALSAQRLASQRQVEAELLDVVARQRYLLQVLVEAADPGAHPSLRNNEYIVKWVANRAKNTLL